MRLLLDTHLLLWTVGLSGRLSTTASSMIGDPTNELFFSSASIWEMAIKAGTGRQDFVVDVRLIRRTLLNGDYTELAITSEHAVAISGLPPIHKDPFDRLLIAQATVEGIVLLTADRTVASYPGSVRLV